MYTNELKTALLAAQAASNIINSYYSKNVNVDHKSKDQPVTVADREADAEIKKILLGAFPDDGWLSEETIDNPDRLSKKRVWVVDPLDGTKEFIDQCPEFAVSIALVENKKVIVGVIHNPVTNEIYHATAQSNAFKNQSPIAVTSQKKLSDATILASRSETKRGDWKVFENQFSIKPSGSMAYKMARVAEGSADASFSLHPKNEWDFAAGDLIVTRAGGQVSHTSGESFTYNNADPKVTGIVHSNPFLFPQIIKLINSSNSPH